MVAAASARMGHTTLHVDTAKYYGGDWVGGEYGGSCLSQDGAHHLACGYC